MVLTTNLAFRCFWETGPIGREEELSNRIFRNVCVLVYLYVFIYFVYYYLYIYSVSLSYCVYPFVSRILSKEKVYYLFEVQCYPRWCSSHVNSCNAILLSELYTSACRRAKILIFFPILPCPSIVKCWLASCVCSSLFYWEPFCSLMYNTLVRERPWFCFYNSKLTKMALSSFCWTKVTPS